MEAGFCGNVKEYARRVMGVSGNLLKHTKQSGGIFVNGEPCFVVRQLKPGDRIALVIENGAASPNVFPRPGELDIVYEDEDILVLNKPAPLPARRKAGPMPKERETSENPKPTRAFVSLETGKTTPSK